MKHRRSISSPDTAWLHFDDQNLGAVEQLLPHNGFQHGHGLLAAVSNHCVPNNKTSPHQSHDWLGPGICFDNLLGGGVGVTSSTKSWTPSSLLEPQKMLLVHCVAKTPKQTCFSTKEMEVYRSNRFPVRKEKIGTRSSKSQTCRIFCRTRWVRSTLSSLCPLSSNQRCRFLLLNTYALSLLLLKLHS